MIYFQHWARERQKRMQLGAMSARLAPLRSVAVSVLIASALALCLPANSQHGAPEQHVSAQLRISLAVRAQRMGRAK